MALSAMDAPAANFENGAVNHKQARHLSECKQQAAFLRTVLEPYGVLQVFIKDVQDSACKHYLGYYDQDHLGQLSEDVSTFSGRASGIYFGLNPLKQECLVRATNCVKPVTHVPAATTVDVIRRRWLLIDLDSVRPAGVSATDKEKQEAYSLVPKVANGLAKLGWPEPAVVDSGNGYQLLYRIDLPVDDQFVVKRCLQSLAQEFDTDTAKVEKCVFDAKRVAKLPGTMACKGPHSADRPHRMSRLLKLPDPLLVVSSELLEQLALRAGTTATSRPAHSGIRLPCAGEQPAVVVARARAYLKKMDPAVSGEHGRNQFLNAACRLVDDFALPEDQARRLLAEYNQRCLPPFDSRGFADKLQSALQKVQERGGPSGRLLSPKDEAAPVRNSSTQKPFIGHLPDFGFADCGHVLSSCDETVAAGIWLWYQQLWQCLDSRTKVPEQLVRQWAWGSTYDRNWKARLPKKVALRLDDSSCCNKKTCTMYGRGQPHRHYRWGWKSYGLLDLFCAPELVQEGQRRTFDLFGEQYQERFTALRRSGRLFNVYWPALVLGSSPKVGWPWRQQRLLVGIVRELTRAATRSSDDLTAEEIVGNDVVATTRSIHRIRCPLLAAGHRYNVFAGNGKRKGKGYQLVGRTGKGWIHRSGYRNADQMSSDQRIEAIRSFLKDLKALSVQLDLIPAAIGSGSWKSIDEMLDCLRSGWGRDWLESCTLRIYVPADWRTRWRAFFSGKLGFTWIPEFPGDNRGASDSEHGSDKPRITAAEIRAFLAQNGLSQKELARRIAADTGESCSIKRVSRHLNGQSNTLGFYRSVERILRQHEDSAAHKTPA